MKIIIAFGMFFITISCISQNNWGLSNTGMPSGYIPNDFTVSSNGDIYLLCQKFESTAFVPKLLKSMNNGSTWTEVFMTGIGNINIPTTVIYSNNKLLLAGYNSSSGACYIMSSVNNGLDWSLSNTGMPSSYSPEDFTVSSNGDIYLLCQKFESTAFVPKLLKSMNNGSTWTEVFMTGIGNLNIPTTVIYSNNNLLLAGYNSSNGECYIMSSVNNGLEWSSSNTGMPFAYSPNDFTVSSNGDIYLICQKFESTSFVPKLLKSTDNGSSWTEVSMTGIGDLNVPTTIIYNTNKLLLAGYNSSDGECYIFKSNLTTIISQEIFSNNIVVFPNPFVDRVNVESNILSGKYYKICIYNSCGEKIYTKNQIYERMISILLDDCNKGIYFLTIETPNIRFFKRIIKN